MVAANFAGIWMVRVVPTAQFYRIPYVLLFVLRPLIVLAGVMHLLHAAH